MDSENIDRKDLFKDLKKIVLKIGTTSLSNEDGSFNRRLTEDIANQVAHLRKLGKTVIIVSSGAIGIGVIQLKMTTRPREIPLRQAAAAVGQNILMQEWMTAFNKHDLKVAQILLTYEAFSNRMTYLNLRNSISALLEAGVVPIINENDPICVHEIEATFGDNDKLSAMVASKVEAELLVLLSDIDGLYDKNPKKNENARLINTVEKITPEIESYGGSPTSTKGVGGMRTKIEAAKITSMAGCHMVIANSAIDDVVIKVISGNNIGTLFLARDGKSRNRTRWIILSKTSGKLIVDKGAKDAVKNGMGLLPSGIVEVSGMFDRGDIIEIESEGKVFAKGITDYTSSELASIKGKHSDMIEKILKVKNYDEVVRKSNIGML
ncbi:MAG: glutamate 5-kinase [Candidatus Methanoperedens nitroreducens]|uniref:Glutamate 5-kinase n=1 Tax=Candidatus Methanoperedens nitratireducens TaxID=1392998 RepID=A0A0P8CMM9_9EURY|nr:glutamate 5-kinase [Candidatus Methanoperedens sp. BLZ2]KAB2941906.1 MAG: glutamate 5-kinase [Candidatus Methanoperedens sp.]KPQ44745.1 MAG: glutamate 5-kinase [Candidatus Methanoperedens sp. BLZ1]MBZ0175999.1 glutamate 5-kinase [Candidatus Methanoperedens nitroreducens]MCX9076700.1 glutamate 5-kinase [Candidatus Methanoperedens sp.]